MKVAQRAMLRAGPAECSGRSFSPEGKTSAPGDTEGLQGRVAEMKPNVGAARAHEDPVGPASFAAATDHRPTTSAAVRELEAHASSLGVPVFGDVGRGIQQAELALGAARDARVTPDDMERAVRCAQQAAALVPARQSALFAFTRVVDAKVDMTPALIETLARSCGDADALRRAVDEGPGDGALVWTNPTTPVELLASLVRQLVLGAGASRQLTVGPELAGWVHAAVESTGAEVKRAMGGAGAFAANIAAAVGVEASFYSSAPLPAAIVERFSPAVQIMNATGEAQAASSFVVDAPARVNTSAEYNDGAIFSLWGETQVRVNGELRAFAPQGTGRVILGTKVSDAKLGFVGVPDDALGRMAQSTDLFFFAGAHHLTQGTESDARAAAEDLARALDVMKRAHPALVRHAQYVVPKVPANEPAVLRALRGAIDSLALNSVEVPMLLDALHRGGLAPEASDPNMARERVESAAVMLDGALALKRALTLPRVHLHGLGGDLVISARGMPGAEDPERQKLALLKARQLASNKAANASGEIKSPEDIWPVVPTVRGTALAELHRFADAVQARFGLDDAGRARVVERWWFRDPATGDVLHYVPSRGIHERSGGTVSLGDTIDAVALFFALQPERRPKLPHASSYR